MQRAGQSTCKDLNPNSLAMEKAFEKKIIMEIEPLAEGSNGQKPKDSGIELKDVSYCYKDATRDAV